MAWPSEAGSILQVRGRHRRRARVRARSRVVSPATFRGRFAVELRGLYRVFNEAEYRFYRREGSPPAESDTPFDTAASLPHEPTETFSDGTWYVAVSQFNGVADSGFLALGPQGETYLKLEIVGGEVLAARPVPPADWRLELLPGGVVRVTGFYYQTDADRATDWAIHYTTDGSPPAADDPTVTVAMTASGVEVLQYDLPSQSHGTVVQAIVQTARFEDPTYIYSPSAVLQSITVDAQGPTAPPAIESWRGTLPEES